jgi:biopolymer transport protein TolQ|tara:strand:- start:478 stop:1167 length:690 start_codon:yes stop_codon:yes gene_type:complete
LNEQLSIIQLVMEASLVVQLVIGLLIVASVFSWGLIIPKYRMLGRAKRKANAFEERFWSGVELSKLFSELNHAPKPATGIERIFVSGFKEFVRLKKQGGASPQYIMDGTTRSMKVAASREVESLESHIPFLATVGSTSPYVGLFGTVWGIMNSFIALGAQKHVTLATVAPGIAEALIATAIGLFAAIPAVIFYNKFVVQLEQVETLYENFIDEFNSILHRQLHVTARQS